MAGKIADMTVEQWARTMPDETMNKIRDYLLRWRPIDTAAKSLDSSRTTISG